MDSDPEHAQGIPADPAPPGPLPPPAAILRSIRDRLARGTDPARLIEELVPRTRAAAVAWARRLPLWDEFRGPYPDQVVALARVASRRALRAFDLEISPEGYVLERFREGASRGPTAPPATLPLTVAGAEVRVEYTRGYFPRSGHDHFAFVSPHTPAEGHPLSATGYLSHFVPHDAVEVCGGPEAYAARFAAARLAGGEQELADLVEGPRTREKAPRRRASPPSPPVDPPGHGKLVADPPAPPPPEVIGEHTAAVVESRGQVPPLLPPRQKTLF